MAFPSSGVTVSRPYAPQGEPDVANEIFDGLWMGGENAGHLAAKGIGDFDVIVNLTGADTNWEPPVAHNRTYVNFRFGDGSMPDLNQLDALVEYIAALFIFKTDKTRKVLVHCTMGVNRSGLVCALVARRVKGLSGLEAVRLVREKRDLKGNLFTSPGTGDTSDQALGNRVFRAYVEALP